MGGVLLYVTGCYMMAVCGCLSRCMAVGARVVWVLGWCGCSGAVGARVVWVLGWCGCSGGVGAWVVWYLCSMHVVSVSLLHSHRPD